MELIERIDAIEILDSRGRPTVKAFCHTLAGAVGTACVPSGASTGSTEALELRDGGERYMGKGVRKAIENLKGPINEALRGMSALDQAKIDRKLVELDGTPQKSKLGANATLGASLACARAGAELVGMPLYRYLGGVGARVLPVPFLNVINGGVHADSGLAIQEFMLVPLGAPSFAEALRWAVETYWALRSLIQERGLSVAVGDEGGFAPRLRDTKEALSLLVEAIGRAGYEPGRDIALALDSAATEFYEDGKYRVDGRELDREGMVGFYSELVAEFPIVSLEDPFAEDDWDGWALLTEALGDRVQIVGDDLLTTNPGRIATAVERGIANSVLIKPNQIGTLTETLRAIEVARSAGYTCIISHRSGETEDPFIADLAVATGVGMIKTGAPARGERTAKYNRLLEIEAELGEGALFLGREALRGA